MDLLLALQRAKCGPLIDPTTYMLYAVKSLSGPGLALSGVVIWPGRGQGVFSLFYSGFSHIWTFSYHFAFLLS